MKILIDMNLSPSWVEFFRLSGIESVHWSSIGKRNAEDYDIMIYAKSNNYTIFTHDLDFGTILAVSNFDKPSVIQIRAQNIMPSNIGNTILKALNQFEDMLNKGALIIIENNRNRARILPLKK
jgi:predicted nuclease of predicted toxin-antitoxin system